MTKRWKAYVFLVLISPLCSLAQAKSLNDCNALLIKESIINKLAGISHYKIDIAVKFDDLNVESNIVGKTSEKMKIQQTIKAPQYTLNYSTVFDGEFQWVESSRESYVQVVKLEVLSLTEKDRPFDTGYYLMGTGLLNGEDYVSTLANLLSVYDLEAVCASGVITLMGEINREKFTHYALNVKTKKSSAEFINKYINEFGYASIEIDKEKLTVNSYKLGPGSNQLLFEALFSNTDINADVDDGMFLYTPPSGIKVLDITNDVKNSRY